MLRHLGMKKGVSDFLLPLPTKTRHGLWIELKRREFSKESEEQVWWIDKMRGLGYEAQFCYGWEHAKTVIEDYLRDL